MKVLHVFKTYYPESIGGVERVIYELCNGMKELGVESHVFYMTRSEPVKEQLFDNHFLHSVKTEVRFASLDWSRDLATRFNELLDKVDVVHFHFPWPVMDWLYLSARRKKPTIVTYHADITKQKWLNKLYQPLMHAFLKKVDVIVATSPNYVESSPVLRKYRDKVQVIPIGIPDDIVIDESLLDSWRAKIPFERFFVFSGALRYYKGLDYLLRAVHGTEMNVVIIGSGTEEMKLKETAQQLNLQNVLFLGSLSEADKIAVLELSYAFVFPSHLRAEAFGVSLLEAARQKKALITTEIGSGMSYVNIDGETGLVVEPKNIESLRDAMLELWDNPYKNMQLGGSAHSRYRQTFLSDAMVTNYYSLYDYIF